MKHNIQLFVNSSPVLKLREEIPSLGCKAHTANNPLLLRVMQPPVFLIQTFLCFFFFPLRFLLLTASFHIIKWEGTFCSISRVSSASTHTLKIPSPPPKEPQHYSITTSSCKRYFISFSCFSLFSQPQSCLLPCNVTSDTFPVSSFFTVCCRFFPQHMGKTVFTLFFPSHILGITCGLNSLHMYTQWKGESVLTERWML